MKIYLIRHGESTSDIEDRFGGAYDDHLTERGISQAKALAKNLANKGIQIVFSSSLMRAKETSEILKKKLKCDIEIIRDIRERNNWGPLSGMKKSEAMEKYPQHVKTFDYFNNAIPDAENYEHFKERVRKSFHELSNSNFETIAIVTHGGPIRLIFREILKLGELENVQDCAVFEIEKQGNELKVKR